MTFYEKIRSEIFDCIKSQSSVERDFTVDIPTVGDFDFFSNALMVFGPEWRFDAEIACVAECSTDNGFLNFRLKDHIFTDFLAQFQIDFSESKDAFQEKLDAYIQLAENEKNLAGESVPQFMLTPEVRRIICLLMKFQYIAEENKKKSDVVWSEIVRLFSKLESGCENLKSFVITYEPLLIAARGSLAKYNS